MGVIIFNGISSHTIPLVVERAPNYVVAARDYELVHVLGKNGDVLIDHGSYQNVPCPYDIGFGSTEKTHSEMASAVSEWLHSASGYARLEDSYDPEHFRMGYYQEQIEFENVLNHIGRATINFICMPQRFLKSGERRIVFTKPGKLYNPTRFEALPLLTIKGTGEGQLTIDGTTLTVSDIGDGVTVDCDLGEAYYDDEPKNDKIQWRDSESHPFPSLKKGLCDISFSGGIVSVEVIPRWWVI